MIHLNMDGVNMSVMPMHMCGDAPLQRRMMYHHESFLVCSAGLSVCFRLFVILFFACCFLCFGLLVCLSACDSSLNDSFGFHVWLCVCLSLQPAFQLSNLHKLSHCRLVLYCCVHIFVCISFRCCLHVSL